MKKNSTFSHGENCVIGNNVKIGENVIIKHNCVIEDNVSIGENSYIDSNTIIRSGVTLGANVFIGSSNIIGEHTMDFFTDRNSHGHPLIIGKDALIRSGSIIYAGSRIGDGFQTGHQVVIREKAEIGDHVSIGTLSDIQGNCRLGNYVRLHSNVHIGQLSQVDDFVWIFPYVVLTNDPTPPSESFVGVHVRSFAIVATAAIIMPGLVIGQDALVGAGAIVTKSVPNYAVAVGNPAKVISDVRDVRNKVTGEPVYPWRRYFSNYMPWADCGFENWYASLDLRERECFSISNIEE